jgi:hypothetical protein
LADFPLVTEGIEEKENAVPVVFIERFGQNLEFLATDEVVHACQVVDLQNQRDAYSTVDGSTAPDGFGSPVNSIVRHVEATEKQDAIALTEMCVSQFATLIRNGKHFPEAKVTVENHGHLDILDRQDGYDRRNACGIVHGVALLFRATNTIDSSEASARLVEHWLLSWA